MKKFLYGVFFLTVLMLAVFQASGASALSNKDYADMKKNVPAFAAADKHLNDAWKALTGQVSAARKKELQESEDNWIKTDRDQYVKYMENLAKDRDKDLAEYKAFLPDSVMKNGKFDRALAYARVTEDRALYLEELAKQEKSTRYLPSFSGKLSFTHDAAGGLYWLFPDGWASPLNVAYSFSDIPANKQIEELVGQKVFARATVTGRLTDGEGFDWDQRGDTITVEEGPAAPAPAPAPAAKTPEQIASDKNKARAAQLVKQGKAHWAKRDWTKAYESYSQAYKLNPTREYKNYMDHAKANVEAEKKAAGNKK